MGQPPQDPQGTDSQPMPTLARVDGPVSRGVRKVARALAYALPVLLVVHIVATLVTGRALKTELAAIARAGQPLSIMELAPRAGPPAANAGRVYQQAFDALRLSARDQWEAAYLIDVAVAREIVQMNEDYFRLLDEASRMPACAFPVEWREPWKASFPHLTGLRDAQRLLLARTHVLTADGRHDEAVESCATMLRIAEHAGRDPTLIAQLAAYSIQRSAIIALSEVMSQGTPSPAACRHLFDQLAAVDHMTPFLRGLYGERAMGIAVFDNVRHGPSPELLEVLTGVVALAPTSMGCLSTGPFLLYRTVGYPFLNLDETAYLQGMAECIEAAALPWPESREKLIAVQAECERLPWYRSVITGMLLPIFERGVSMRDEATARLGAAQIALAVAAHQGEEGRYPTALAGLQAAGWKLPQDPFGGQAYRFRTEGAGFVVWSLGPDMDDDDGRPLDRAALHKRKFQSAEEYERAKTDYDIVFRCQR